MKILIRGAHIVDPANRIDQVEYIAVADKKIAAVGTVNDSFTPDRVIEAENRLLLPGIIDMCARLR